MNEIHIEQTKDISRITFEVKINAMNKIYKMMWIINAFE